MILTGTLLDNLYLYYLDAEYVRVLSDLDGNRPTTPRTTPECAHNYWWSGCCDITHGTTANAVSTKGSTPKRLKSTICGLTPIQVLHRRWGHLSEKNIKRELSHDMVHGAKYTFDEIKDAQLPVCFDCLRGRMKAFPRIVPHLTEDTKVYKNLEKIAVDYKGKFPVKSIHGNDGFYLIVDQASKLVHAHVCAAPRMRQS